MNLFNQILDSTKGLHGWCEPAKQITLANYVFAIKPKCIVEIGVWGGKSLIPMAMADRALVRASSAKVVAVDPWAASSSVDGQTGVDAEWWNNQKNHELVYESFREALARLGLTHVQVCRKPSDEAIETVRFYGPISILHIDGNHGPQAIKDVMNYAPMIEVGGICVLDDLNWAGGAVGKAAEWLKANGFLELHPLGTGAVFQKIN